MAFWGKKEAPAPTPQDLLVQELSGSCDLQKILELEKLGADINRKDGQGYTPLIRAAKAGSVKAVRTLIAAHASLEERTPEGDTALTKAVYTCAYHFSEIIGTEYPFKVWDQALPQLQPYIDIAQSLTDAGAAIEDKALDYSRFPGLHAIHAILHDAEKQRKQQALPQESWSMPSPGKVVHVEPLTVPGGQLCITDIFNFATRERLVVTRNCATGAEAVSVPASFEQVQPATLDKALAVFKSLGGDATRIETLGGRKPAL